MANKPNLVTGALVGYVSSRIMDATTTRYYDTQSQESKDREAEITPDGMLAEVGQQIGSLVGKDLSPEEASRVGLFAHRTLGTTYGVLATALMRRGMHPMVAAPIVGTAAWLIVDEGASLPTFRQYYKESHYRGIIGHATWGISAGILLTLTNR